MKHPIEIRHWKRLALFDPNQAAADFATKSKEDAQQIAETLGAPFLAKVISRIGTDAAGEILVNLPSDIARQVLSHLSPEKAAALNEIATYEVGTAGNLMATEVLSVPIESTIGEVSKYVRSVPLDQRGKVSYIYVVDSETRLEGVIQVRDLVFYDPERSIREILKSPVVQVETGMKQQDVARLLQRHRYLGLPVVDQSQRLVGVISADSAMKVMEEEASDDIAKIIGTSAGEIRAHSVRSILRFRLPWLLVNIASGLGCAYISGIFQNDPAVVASLFLFIPVVLGLSESTGVQGATMVVRGFSLGPEAGPKLGSLFIKEALAGLGIGIICGALVGLAGKWWLGDARLGIALTASLCVSVTISAWIGLCLPFVFKKFKMDPAIGSGPIVLAVCDIQTLIVYFNLCSFILKYNI